MADSICCPDCGAVLPTGAPTGVCPRCQTRFGPCFEPPGPAGGPTTARPSAPEAPDLGRGDPEATGDHTLRPAPPSTHTTDAWAGGPTVTAGDGAAAGLAPGSAVRYFGDYEIKRELGRGGMGIVYEAHQVSLNRPVALKMIKAGALADDGELRRFQNEAEAVALLDHPGIVPVYEVGEHEGQRYFSMKLVEGGNLADQLATMKASPRASATLLAETADAVHHAHMRGILHRDLKPANILVDTERHPHVTDFGLAKRVEGDVEMTASGAILGTPAYMSPEQASGRRGSITTATDVYGLGAILYALLAGKAPFGGGSVIDTLDAVRSRPPESPKKFNALVPRDLETICLKCLEKDPRRRYASAHGLADDLRNWLDSRPIAARRVGVAERARLWCRRRPAVAGLSVAVLLATAAGIAAVFTVQARANATLKVANNNLKSANADLENERARVEFREKQAVEAIRRFGDAIANEPVLKNSSALKDLRRRLLREPIAFLRSLRDGLQADAGTRPESLEALSSAAYQHAFLSHAVGDREDAHQSFVEGRAILERLVREYPADEDYRSKLARTHFGMANVLVSRGQPREARESLEQARKIYSELGRREDRPEYRLELARCDLMLGILDHQAGRPEPALASLHAARDEYERLLPRSREPAVVRSELAMGHLAIGAVEEILGRFPEALAEYRKALDVLDRLVREDPAVASYRLDQARTHCNLGKILILSGKAAEAEAALERSRTIFESLAAEHPSTTDHQSGLAGCYISLSQVAATTSRPKVAETHLARARTILERMATEHPESPDFASELGATLHNLGQLQLDARNFTEARDLLREAMVWQRKAMATNPANPRYRECINAHLESLGRAASGADDVETLEQVRKDRAQFAATDPRRIALEERLSAIIKGAKPGDLAEGLALAQHAQETERFATAARLWAEAFDTDPKVTDDRRLQPRYNAACAAAMAAAGKGKDDPPPDEVAKAKLRRQAFDWLRAERAAWARLLESGPPQIRPAIAQTLRHWLEDTDLAGIRDLDAMEELPPEERKSWRTLWEEVETLLKQSQGS